MKIPLNGDSLKWRLLYQKKVVFLGGGGANETLWMPTHFGNLATNCSGLQRIAANCGDLP
jgi:hypothetical protein